MDSVQDLYFKKFQAIQESYERISDKISESYSKRRIAIEEQKDAALATFSYTFYQNNPDAYNAALNAVYKAYGEKLESLQEEYNNEINRVSVIHESNKRQLTESYTRAYQEYQRSNEQFNAESSEKIKAAALSALRSTNPVAPRITTISSAR
jgi:hypothetical protein